jgi:hypothetical protein
LQYISEIQDAVVPKRFRFLNADQFGTILAVRRFNRFPLATARNRLQDAVLHYDHTRAVEPLERSAEWQVGEVEETFPSGL